MNATANSGSIPDEQPAMIEIVPVGATVVRLQLRSRRRGRMRSPWALRAQVASGPQIDRSHSANVPRCSASFSDATFDSSSMRSEEHTSELQSPCNLVCRLLLEKKKEEENTHHSGCNSMIYS